MPQLRLGRSLPRIDVLQQKGGIGRARKRDTRPAIFLVSADSDLMTSHALLLGRGRRPTRSGFARASYARPERIGWASISALLSLLPCAFRQSTKIETSSGSN